VRRLWGIGPVAEEKLNRLGIETIEELAALTDAEVANILGATIGPALHRLARGVDDRPVTERAEAKQISSESTFAADLTSLDQLREAIDPIAEHAHRRLLRDGRGARTVTVKLKKSDMGTLTRSATLPYATTEAGALIAVARRLLLDPREIGPIRLLGVGFSGLTDVRQESLFPDLELSEPESDSAHPAEIAATAAEAMFAPTPEASPWRIGDDVAHCDLGHGWVQGAGHGVVTVRFETRGSGPGQARTFPADTGDLSSANPLDSLDWSDYVEALRARDEPDVSAPTGDDVGDG
jgi:DNA polymerase IV